IAIRLNSEGIAGPQRMSDASVEKLQREGKDVPVNPWSVSGVREVLHRDMYRGAIPYGRIRRTGPNTRERVPREQWQWRQDESLRIVSDELWAGAHARISKSAFLRARGGHLIGQVERARGQKLLSGLLVCGAPAKSPREHGGTICGETLVASVRGK